MSEERSSGPAEDAGTDVDKTSLLGLLGLARRAKRLAVGHDAVAQMVAKGKRPLVVIATDASPRQKEKLMRLQPVRAFWTDRLDREEMASALGRKELVVAALDDPDFLRGLGLDEGRKRSGRPRRNSKPPEGR